MGDRAQPAEPAACGSGDRAQPAEPAACGNPARAQPAEPAACGFGIGLDLLEIGRLERALARRPQLAERLFTDGELAYAAERARPSQHLAARFCAKEAVAKALGLQAWAFRQVEVVATGGAPEIRLYGAAADRARAMGAEVRVSLTHTGETAGAVAIASSS